MRTTMEPEAVVGMPEKLRDLFVMCQAAVEMLRLTWEGFRKQDTAPLDVAERLGREIHQQEKMIGQAMLQKPAPPAGALPTDQGFLFLPMHLERIGDNVDAAGRATRTMVREGIPFTERAMREVNTLFERVVELTECVRDLVPTRNSVLVRHILEEGKRCEELANEYAMTHQQRLIEGVCIPKASSVYLAILDALRAVEWHTRQIAHKLSAVAAT